MPIAHVEYGKEGDPTHQNQIIDQVNENTSDIATLQGDVAAKPDPCDDNPQDVADTPDPGDAADVSRCNHKHRGVRKIIAGSGVGVSPPSGQGDVTLTAAAVPLSDEYPLAPEETPSPGTGDEASRWDHVHPAVAKIVAGTGITINPPSGKGEVEISAAAGIQSQEFSISAGDYNPGNVYLGAINVSDIKVLLGLRFEASFKNKGAGTTYLQGFAQYKEDAVGALTGNFFVGGAAAKTLVDLGVAASNLGGSNLTQANTVIEVYLGVGAAAATIYSGKVTVYYL